MPHRCAACSPYQVTGGGGGGASIHGLSGTEDVRASPFGCIRPEKVNRFMLHVAAYVMHSQLLGSDICIAEFALFSLSGSKGGCRCMAGLAQIAHRRRRAGTLDSKVGAAA